MRFLVLLVFSTLCLAAHASGPGSDRYPLRIYVFTFTSHPVSVRDAHRSGGDDFEAGSGRADLFEEGHPRGFQFSYSCMANMRASGRYSTLPARWKKPGKTLEVLLPRRGKPEDLESCDLQTILLPEQVFYWKDGEVSTETSAALKEWMVKHKFDPEASEAEPVFAAGESDTAGSPLMSPD